MSKGYLRKDVAQKLGISASTIQSYTDNEVVEPEIVSPPRGEGKGCARRYSDFNLVEILIVKEFVKRGVKLRVLKKIMRNVRNHFREEVERVRSNEGDNVYMVIWDHADENKVEALFSTRLEPGSGDYNRLSKERRDKIKQQATTININMKNKKSAIILNVSELWASL